MNETFQMNYDRYQRALDGTQRATQFKYVRLQAQSDSRVSFFDKLAVFSAGSIGAITSLVGAAISSKVGSGSFAPTTRWCVVGAVVFLGSSLVGCLLHNF